MIDNAPEELQTHPVTLELVADAEDWEGTFDQIEVWRSRSTAGGPFEELTAADYLPARIPQGADGAPASPVVGPLVNVSGKQLDLLFRERDEISLVFSGTNPLTFADAAQQITDAGRRLVRAYVAAEGALVLETYGVGTTAVLRVLGGEAAPILGLDYEPPESQGFGRDARIPLTHGQEVYRFTDGFGSERYWYKLRFRHRMVGTTSEFTPPFQTGASTAVPATNIVVGELTLVDLAGKAVGFRDVRISRAQAPVTIEEAVIVGRDQQKFTDLLGHVEFSLIRGQPVTLAVAGTDIVVEVTPPTDLSIGRFNLFDPQYINQNDYFKVRVANIPYAARRTL